MLIISPSFTIEEELNGEQILKKIERAGRTCYKSEDRIGPDTAHAFVKRVVESAHESVLEHEKITVRFICDRGVNHELVRHRIASSRRNQPDIAIIHKEKYGSEITVIKPCFGRKEVRSSGAKVVKRQTSLCDLLKLGASRNRLRLSCQLSET